MAGGGVVFRRNSCSSVAGMKQIEIVGGGLAGLALGIAIRRREVPVILREATTYPRHRVCGEFINGVTIETLENLGIAHLFSDALQHEKTRWWVGDEKILEARLSKPALGMSRWEMDERLRQEFERLGGDLIVRDRVNREAMEGRVWTAGRRLEKGTPWLGLKAHFDGVPLDGYLEMHLGNGGYVGLTPIEGDGCKINVCGLFRGAKMGKGNPLLNALDECGLEKLVDRLRGGEMNQKSLTGISGFRLGSQQVDHELCVLGDAERMIPPFTGNGMSMAFESAECALEPLMIYAQEGAAWDATRKRILLNLEERFGRRVRLAMSLHRILTNRVGRMGISLAAKCGVLPFQWLHRKLC